MKAPRILISGVAGDRRNYELAVRRAGGKPLSCYCPSLQIPADGLLLAGGGDISPGFLGEEDRGTRDTDLARDLAEFALVSAFLAQNKPIFGICRGHQVLNVALGGTLQQDIGQTLERFHSPVPHAGSEDLLHSICTQPGSLMASLYGKQILVNSWHHQAITKPGKGMRICATSEGGLAEACEHETLPLLSVQFHPERLRAAGHGGIADGDKLFSWFIARCRESREPKTKT